MTHLTSLPQSVARAWRAPLTHVLKTDPQAFDDVAGGFKTFELRKLDRDYRIGDTLLLVRTKHTSAEMAAGAALDYTGDAVAVLVTHILTGYGLPDELCGLSVVLKDDLSVPAIHTADMAPSLRTLLVERRRILKSLCVPGYGERSRNFAAAAELMRSMTEEEVEAANRFVETGLDDGTYDIAPAMRTRLRDLGLIRHAGGSRFQATALMSQVLDTVARQEVT